MALEGTNGVVAEPNAVGGAGKTKPGMLGLNKRIREHALAATDWRHHEVVTQAYATFDAVNSALFDGMLPDVLVSIDQTGRLKREGTYYFAGDGMSLYYHIDLRPDLTNLGLVVAMIHNCLHLKQESEDTEKGWYHTTKWMKAMKEFGILVSKKNNGGTVGFNPQFKATAEAIDASAVLDEVETWTPDEGGQTDWAFNPDDEVPDASDGDDDDMEATETGHGAKPETEVNFTTGAKASTKMIRWACHCTNVRVATTLVATCHVCQYPFVKGEKATMKASDFEGPVEEVKQPTKTQKPKTAKK